MCEWLLHLKIYFSLLENEGNLTCNLTESQWLIVHDLHIVLKPFIQRLLEGDDYVTIRLVPFMVYKIMRGLQQDIESPTYIRGIATGMVMNLTLILGMG
jgi:hypothetical protein